MQQLSQRGVDKEAALILKRRRQDMFVRSAAVETRQSRGMVLVALLALAVLFSAVM